MTFSPNAQTIFSDGPTAAPHQPSKSEIRALFVQYETVMNAFTNQGNLIYSTKAAMEADASAFTQPRSAWVYADPVTANNGIYALDPATDIWAYVGRLPYDFVIGTDLGSGTANAIQITTDIPVADGMIVAFSLFKDTTSSPVTGSINGGTALTLKSNRGNNASALTADMEIWGRYRASDSTLRLLNDQDVAALVAQAEAAAAAAEEAAILAEAAAAAVGTINIDGAAADGVTDDTAAVQAAVDAAIAKAGDGFVIVDGRGLPYALSAPIVLGTGVLFQNFKLVALASATWSSSNAMLETTTGYNILIDNVYLEGNKQAKNCYLNTQAGFIRMSNCRAIRFLEKGYFIKADVGMVNCQAQQYGSTDTEFPAVGNAYDFSALTGYPLYLSDDATDSKFIGCVFAWGISTFYIGYGVHHVQFIGCHFFNGVSGSARPASKNGDIYGYRVQFVGCYLDLGAIWYYVDGTNTTVDMTVSGCISLYAAGSALFDGWFVITTSVAATEVATLKIGAGNQWSGNGAVPVVNLKTSGGGSWNVNAALNNVTDDMQTVGAGLNVVATDVASAQVEKLFGSHPTLALTRWRAIGTSNTSGVEIGASGNNLLERVNGGATREVSATDGSHDFKGGAVKNYIHDILIVTAGFTYTRATHLGRHILADNTGAAITINLPQTALAGDHFWINRYRTNAADLTPTGAAQLNLAGVAINPARYGWVLVECVRNTGGSAAEWIVG